MGAPYRSTFMILHGDAAYDTIAEVIALIGAAAHADYLKIWEHTIPSQQIIAWGYGTPALPYNQGYMWFVSVDSATDFDVGTLRLCQSKARGRNADIVAELPDRQLHNITNTSAAAAIPDKRDMMPLPEKVEFPMVGEDSLMYLTYALHVAATTHDDAAFEIPITVRE